MEVIEKLQKKGIAVSDSGIGRLCKKYYITELAVFGSAMFDEMGKNGDLYFLVSFEEGAAVTVFDIIEMEREFEKLLGMKATIVEKAAVTNPARREKILSQCQSVYAC